MDAQLVREVTVDMDEAALEECIYIHTYILLGRPILFQEVDHDVDSQSGAIFEFKCIQGVQ